ncbi:hypothetical protein H257_00836 [Aphanomyces astaci]|uniref:Uncharacterized protein n=1 Tax=Aphanomyces astaci TaxID=112090 RepID=W4HCJ9_APHAT|nr:hypothetical protein H257_00836 [Aphanomyces astaci]ETV89632.1 hypothetical protein H257_00836 [Aphanomyces astaci]RQM22323.1 hypothetical protein B5M09_009434 [Aphanomyces astaci]|eukprot:XP_009822032.1 hypothetical protein H257_00836 [Aphanomyces astaci]
MGRLASKRKLKQCDPFFKGKKTVGTDSSKYDMAPTLSKRKKKMMNKEIDQAAIDRFVLGNGSTSGGGKKKKSGGTLADVEGRRPGETMRAFNHRMGTEVKRVLAQETKKTQKTTIKRKSFLESKKEKTRRKKLTEQERYELEFQETGSTKKDNFEGAERIRFGERYDAPPILPVLKGTLKRKADDAAANRAKKHKA